MKINNRVDRIIKKYHTPCYIFFDEEIRSRIVLIRDIVGEDPGICYAIKANPFIVPLMKKYVDRFEACSHGEYKILVERGIEKDRIVYSGVNKSYEIMNELYSEGFSGICTIESVIQFEHLKKVCEENKCKSRVLIRATSGNQFGVAEDDLRMIIGECTSVENMDLAGIHFFSGTQKKDVGIIKDEVGKIRNLCDSISKKLGTNINEIEYGPGLFADYFGAGNDTEYINEALLAIKNGLRGFKVTLELGRFLAYKCGKYYTSVVDKKYIGGKQYVIVDGGIHQVNYYGQLLGIRVPDIKLYHDGIDSPDEMESIICGSLCTVNDILVKKWKGNIQMGDIFEFNDAGAYSCTEGGLLFLSRDLPAMIAVDEEGEILLRDHTPTYVLNGGA